MMGRAIDATGIQFKLLIEAVDRRLWSPRAQADKRVTARGVKSALEAEPHVAWIFGKAARNFDVGW
jgi:tRNA uridine 5-carboxymethylaminomethyl modification enzyme